MNDESVFAFDWFPRLPAAVRDWLEELLDDLPEAARVKLQDFLSSLPEPSPQDGQHGDSDPHDQDDGDHDHPHGPSAEHDPGETLPSNASDVAQDHSRLGSGESDEEEADDSAAGTDDDEDHDHPHGASADHGPDHDPGVTLPSTASSQAQEHSPLGSGSGDSDEEEEADDSAAGADDDDRDPITGSSFATAAPDASDESDTARAFAFGLHTQGVADDQPGQGARPQDLRELLFEILPTQFFEGFPGMGDLPTWPPASESFHAAPGQGGEHPPFDRLGQDHPLLG